jgi:hypothetical protein
MALELEQQQLLTRVLPLLLLLLFFHVCRLRCAGSVHRRGCPGLPGKVRRDLLSS